MRVPPALDRRGAQTALALLAYAVFTIVITWPLLAHLDSTVYLVPPTTIGAGDLGGSVAHLRELVEGHHNPFLPGRISDFNAPDGLPIRWALNIASFPSVVLLYVLAAAFGATAAQGLFVMLGYVASGLAMFLLARWLTRSAWIGFVAGWAFAFYPFAQATGEHPHFVHGWVFVVMLWRFLVLLERPTPKNGVWAGAATVLCFAWTQYFILLGGIAFWTLTFAVLAFGATRRQVRRHLAALLPAVGIAGGFVLVMRALLVSGGENETLPTNSLLDIVHTSAHLPMYLVPPAHHILGSKTVSYLNSHGWNAVEWTLYVGLTVLALALIGLFAAALRRLPPHLMGTAVVCAALVAVAFVFSLPPEAQVGGRTIHTPSWLVFHASPNWRLYTRFVIVVVLGLCVLAALGLRALVAGRPARVQAAILALATVLVPLDLWDRPPQRTYTFHTPGIYQQLRAQPEGIVAEYPLRSVAAVGDYLDLFYQDAHGKPILNGYFHGPDERRALSIAGLDDPHTPAALATLGVRYVLLVPRRVLPEVPPPGRPGKGFQRIASDEYGTLYRVTAAPVPFVWLRDGFWGPEGEGMNRSQWAGVGPVRLGIDGRCSPCRGDLVFTASSFAHSRVLKVRSEEGKQIGAAIVETRPTVVRAPLTFDRHTVVELEISPGPQVINETIPGSTDNRNVSVSIQGAHFGVRR